MIFRMTRGIATIVARTAFMSSVVDVGDRVIDETSLLVFCEDSVPFSAVMYCVDPLLNDECFHSLFELAVS